MTVSDKMNVNVNIGNLNPFTLNIAISSPSSANNTLLAYSIPSGTFTVRSRTSITKTI